jgi:hypothetical protein
MLPFCHMVPVYKPENPVELALAECELEACGIPYFVHNRGFGGLYPGVQIDLHNVRTIMVPEAAVEDAREVLARFIQPPAESPAEAPLPVSGWHKLRMVTEALLGFPVVPPPRRKE